ncbi:hypothetical protein AB0P17_36760 [Streptomyces sp. NPDC088124]|uniref:hypothetical protein n=1 Tax=Streptomyces sp. NPDC088124 TaxID=3154654 RepID=UPI0034192DF4
MEHSFPDRRLPVIRSTEHEVTMLWPGPPITAEDVPGEPHEPGAPVPCAPCLAGLLFELRSPHRCEEITAVRAGTRRFTVTDPMPCPCECRMGAEPEST